MKKFNEGQSVDVDDGNENEDNYVERNEFTPDYLRKGGIVIVGNPSDDQLCGEDGFIESLLQEGILINFTLNESIILH